FVWILDDQVTIGRRRAKLPFGFVVTSRDGDTAMSLLRLADLFNAACFVTCLIFDVDFRHLVVRSGALRMQHAGGASTKYKGPNEGARNFVILHWHLLPGLRARRPGRTPPC